MTSVKVTEGGRSAAVHICAAQEQKAEEPKGIPRRQRTYCRLAAMQSIAQVGHQSTFSENEGNFLEIPHIMTKVIWICKIHQPFCVKQHNTNIRLTNISCRYKWSWVSSILYTDCSQVKGYLHDRRDVHRIHDCLDESTWKKFLGFHPTEMLGDN